MFFFGQLIKDILARQETSRTAEVEFLRKRVIELESVVFDMKREGFTRPPPLTQFNRPLLSDDIMAAIDNAGPEGSTIHSDLLEYARSRQLLKIPDDVIADEIYKGGAHEDFD